MRQQTSVATLLLGSFAFILTVILIGLAKYTSDQATSMKLIAYHTAERSFFSGCMRSLKAHDAERCNKLTAEYLVPLQYMKED